MPRVASGFFVPIVVQASELRGNAVEEAKFSCDVCCATQSHCDSVFGHAGAFTHAVISFMSMPSILCFPR